MAKIRPFKVGDKIRVTIALELLRRARDELVAADCPRAAFKVRRAITSTGGALRHVEHRMQRRCVNG